MGLDITAYSKLTKLDAVFDAAGDPIDPVTRVPLDDYARFTVNTDFPGRAGSVEDGAVYSYEYGYGFYAGSYGGYSAWRERLAQLAGFPAISHETVPNYAPSAKMLHSASAWRGLCEGRPFVELVNFSDCEGTIGPEIAAKLAKDFADFDDIAKAVGGYFYERFSDWRRAFEMASDSGAVSFH